MVINLKPDSFNSRLTKTEKQLNKLKDQMVSSLPGILYRQIDWETGVNSQKLKII